MILDVARLNVVVADVVVDGFVGPHVCQDIGYTPMTTMKENNQIHDSMLCVHL